MLSLFTFSLYLLGFCPEMPASLWVPKNIHVRLITDSELTKSMNGHLSLNALWLTGNQFLIQKPTILIWWLFRLKWRRMIPLNCPCQVQYSNQTTNSQLPASVARFVGKVNGDPFWNWLVNARTFSVQSRLQKLTSPNSRCRSKKKYIQTSFEGLALLATSTTFH